MSSRWKSCYTCRDCADHRKETIAEPLAAKAKREGRDVIEVVDEFMYAAHDRHTETGEPLRVNGPTRFSNPEFGRLAALLSPGLFRDQETP